LDKKPNKVRVFGKNLACTAHMCLTYVLNKGRVSGFGNKRVLPISYFYILGLHNPPCNNAISLLSFFSPPLFSYQRLSVSISDLTVSFRSLFISPFSHYKANKRETDLGVLRFRFPQKTEKC
jgi:hypothetical protein